MPEEKETFKHERARMVEAAKDLCYGKEYIEQLKRAKTIYEIDRIMATARNERC